MYQQEQTKIMRFAHLADDTVAYNTHLKEAQLIPSATSDDPREGIQTKVLSNISIRKLRETWRGLKKPVRLLLFISNYQSMLG